MFVPPEWWARGYPMVTAVRVSSLPGPQNRYRCQELHHCQDPKSVSLPGTASLPRPKIGIAARNCITAKIL